MRELRRVHRALPQKGRRDPMTIKIDKDATTKRIDPVDAALAGFKLALYHDFEVVDMNEYVAKFLEEMA